jgi:putative endonuclease
LFRAKASWEVEILPTFEPCVYLLANRYRGALYTGVTSDLIARIHQHREETFGGYTSEHGIKLLVWFERHDDIEAAIRREKAIKRWRRQWKFNVIEEHNPDWRDLAVDLGFPALR